MFTNKEEFKKSYVERLEEKYGLSVENTQI